MNSNLKPTPLAAQPQQKPRKKANALISLLLAAGLVVGGGWGLQTMFGSDEAGNLPPAVAATQSTDDLTNQQKQERQQKFQATGATFSVRVLSEAETQQKMAQAPSVGMPDTAPESAANLLEGLANGTYSKIVELTVWDDVAQDGDIVQIQSLDHAETIPLMHKPHTTYFPVQDGKAVTITGIRDGGGGITLGFTGSGQPISLPVLNEGEHIDIWLQ